MPMYSVDKVLKQYQKKSEHYWIAKQGKKSLSLFKRMSKEISAYKKFLKQKHIHAKSIRYISDLTKIPPINKNNYFRKFPLDQVTNEGFFSKNSSVLTATTGSTGEPVYFPRAAQIDWQYSVLAEYFLDNGPAGSTLLINCFGMGVWIGGVITYQAFYLASLRGRPVTIISPGVNKKEIFHALTKMAPFFKNIILAGYPPLLKDVIDDAVQMKIDLDSNHFRLLFAAESFSENFRDYVCEKLKIKDTYNDTLNIYGSAELGAMAFETPGSIFIRRLACRYPGIYRVLFGTDQTVTLAQYNPDFVSFSEEQGEILITADSVTPFVRYQIGDRGGVFGLNDIVRQFKSHGIDLFKESKKSYIKFINLPFVYLYERSDFSTKFYGAIIYPGPIREALISLPCNKYCTGKFMMQTKVNKKHDQYLEIHVELKLKVRPAPSVEKNCVKSVTDYLIKKNAEYKYLYGSIPKKVVPKIILHFYEEPEFFKPGIKQKWVKKKI